MGRQNTDLKHNKNKILLLTYIFRCLPTLYINNIGKTNNEKQALRNVIVLLKRNKFVTLRKALHGLTFLTLTKNGYDFFQLVLALQTHTIFI